MDWTKLSLSTRKNLVFIMLRASRPIIIKCGPLVHYTLSTYLKVNIEKEFYFINTKTIRMIILIIIFRF